MNFVSKTATCVVLAGLMAGCSAPRKVAAPPEIIRVPTYMPLPEDCAIQHPVNLPPESSAGDVMLEQRAVIDAYRDQVERCYEASNGP